MNQLGVDIYLAQEAITEAWDDLHEAHLNFYGLNADRMDDFSWWKTSDVQEKANEYFKAVQMWEKLMKKMWGG